MHWQLVRSERLGRLRLVYFDGFFLESLSVPHGDPHVLFVDASKVGAHCVNEGIVMVMVFHSVGKALSVDEVFTFQVLLLGAIMVHEASAKAAA